MKLSEDLTRIISLAKSIRMYWEEERPKRHPNYPLICLNEDFGPPPEEKQQLRRLLESFTAAELYLLTLLMYVGRGDMGVDDLLDDYESMSDSFSKPQWAVDQLLSKSSLDIYLTTGMARLSEAQIDLQQWFDL
jgi:hypothetical protein